MRTNSLDGLTLNGFENSIKDFDKTVFDENKISEIRQFVLNNFTKIKSCNTKISSYGLKHVVESAIGSYVSNGEMIFAMDLEKE